MRVEDYPYLYETHLHTCQGSACGRKPGREMAKAARQHGYSGIFVTDHNWGGNCAVGRNADWETWVTEFCKGYEDAKAWGDENDFPVFFGYEAGFSGTEFLIYGIDKEWLLNTPGIRTATVEQQYKLVHEAGGMVIHAHPFREEDYIPMIRLFPEFVDGVEGINAAHSNFKTDREIRKVFDDRAIEYALKNRLPMTAGSDIHTVPMLGGGVAFKTPLKDAGDYIQRILNDEDYILTNGSEWYDKKGNFLKNNS